MNHTPERRIATEQRRVRDQGAEAIYEELAEIASITRSIDGTGVDVDWFELAGDVRALKAHCDELAAALREVKDWNADDIRIHDQEAPTLKILKNRSKVVDDALAKVRA